MNVIFVPLSEQLYGLIPTDYRPRMCVDSRGVFAIDKDTKELLAACIFDSWSFNSCQIHIYIANPFVLKHGFAEEVFGFAFGSESGREIIIGVTPADNERAIKFIKNIGFEEVARIKDGYKKGVDYVLTQIRKEDCKWISHDPVQLELEMGNG